ncbi:hypothetical protein ABC977_05150 [Thioalkalicoccus limnaeus]|uniref:Uncharacterized protein n=1 Tax=Thioalkalicoccus limnaeus TaxID=120681 RepID=A0ABV4BCS5_9GAMM
MGKTRRQVPYLIQNGQLTARKVSGLWVIDSADLPLSDGQRQALARDAAIQAVCKLLLTPTPAERLAEPGTDRPGIVSEKRNATRPDPTP